MEDDFERQHIANIIESAISSFDLKQNDQMHDDMAIRIIERMIDYYYFNEPFSQLNDEVLTAGYYDAINSVENSVNESHEEITKVLGAIYFVAKRRTQGKREYLDFIRKYVGISVGKGIRALTISM
jgi:hypothetical protein